MKLIISILLVLFTLPAFALCNGGVTVTTTLEVTASCNGGNVKGLTLDTGADVTIASGVTVSNDAPFGVNGRSVVILETATSAKLVNNGSIYTNNQWGVWNKSGGNVDVVNFGQITGVVRYGISNQSTITSLTNIGSIKGGFASIGNASASLQILNNFQGSHTTGPLNIRGNLPENYNIIIKSPTQYGQFSALSFAPGNIQISAANNGNMAFNIYGNLGTTLVSGVDASVVSEGRYLEVLQDFPTLNNISDTTGTYGRFNYSLVANESLLNAWDLLFKFAGPSAIDTQASVQSLASDLRGGFSQQLIATNFANMNTYDCDLFDTRGFCVSVGGQQTYVDNPSTHETSAVIVVGYKATPTLRLGGFLNHNFNTDTVDSVDISNANPLMGIFIVWNQNADHLGYQFKIANAYQDKNLTTTREIMNTSEAGVGDTSINTQSYVGELSYSFLVNEARTLVRPYAALRYTRIKQDAYTEEGSIFSPLTYAALEDRSTVALVGMKLNQKLTEKVTLTGSLGIEHDLSHSVDDLTATGVSGLTSENFNDNLNRTRPVASIGAYFSPAINQRISADFYYQQLPFQSTGSATAYVNYTIGL
ncbi:autotransporter domain-containing protein [Methylophaga sp.]|uniref:autotransporter domain-containing protein n=1 Tax=Methylophaga sp. TaxID=2024840 RepID=UPI000C0EFF62|nr:autotransporter domain-containing protein [Methylophaga sp.]MBL1458307.1 autotransporter domain-containing protein [Methylophaga sp.]